MMRGLDADERALLDDIGRNLRRAPTATEGAVCRRLYVRGLVGVEFSRGKPAVFVTKLGRDVYEWSKMAR